MDAEPFSISMTTASRASTMTVQDGVGGAIGAAQGKLDTGLDRRLCCYLMLQHAIGQKEERDMRINVDHIS